MKPTNKRIGRPAGAAILVVAAAMLLLVGIGQSNHVLASSQSSGLSSHQVASNQLGTHQSAPLDAWSALGSGLDLDCDAIAISGNDIYVGGAFSHAGGVLVHGIAKWDGSTWSALGSGFNNGAYAVAASGSDVYVGGPFTYAGGASANHIAKWDGSAWSTLGVGTNNGTNNAVRAIAISGSNVYVGGDFTTAGGAPANFIAKWDGSAWSALGSGVNGYVYGMAASGSDLYVTGQFSTAGGVTVHNVAKWNGSSWSALGSGLGSVGRAVAISGSDVYVGGEFIAAGGVSANRVARWDGSSWHALGNGLDNSAYAILANGPDVYVGGRFTAAGGAPASRVAGWNGSTWFDLAGGVTYTGQLAFVYTLAMDSSGLYVGGSFTNAGAIPAAEIALWQTTGLPTVTPGPSFTPTNTPTNTSTRTPTNTPTRTSSPTATYTSVPGDHPPTVTVPLNRPYRIGVEVGNYLALRFDGSDPDVGDSVTFSVSGVPSGASFPIPAPGNPIYSTLTWHPTAPDVGTYFMTVIGTDTHGAQDAATVEIDVVPGCVPYFSDVFTTDYFYPGVQYLFCHLVVSGYIEPDQTFTYRPYNNTTRGQFSKMVVGAYQIPAYNPPTPDFTDVPTSNPFYSYIEAAYHAGIVSGYSDHTFHPFASITRGQLSKLIVGAAGWAIDTTGGPHFTDVVPGSTFYGFIETAYHHDVIAGYQCGGVGEPCDPQGHAYFRVGNTALRGQIAKILWLSLGSPQ